MDNPVWSRILNPEILVFLLPIIICTVAIIAGAITKIVKMIITHNERIAMIQHGIHPDYPPENVEVNQDHSTIK